MVSLKESLLKVVVNSDYYKQGENLYKQGFVTLVSNKTFWKSEVELLATVKEDNRQYEVKLMLKGDQIFEYVCNCNLHNYYNGMCHHGIAAALAYENVSKLEQQPCIHTSNQVRSIIRGYTDIEYKEVMIQGEERKVSLYINFIDKGEYLAISLMVGREKQYQIPDLLDFIEAIKNSKVVEYGKFLSFCHGIEAFSPEYKSIILLIEEFVSSYWINNKSSGSDKFYTKTSWLALSPIALDHIMELLIDKNISFTIKNRKVMKVIVKEEIPPINIIIRPKGLNGFSIIIDGRYPVFWGKRYLYLLTEEYIYCCNEEFSKDMGVFLKHINVDYAYNNSFDISIYDMPVFCDRILPRLAKHCKLIEDNVDFSLYKPEELKVRFEFDCKQHNEITLNPIFSYGDISFHPLRGVKLPKNTYRDEPRELRISQSITKFFKSKEIDSNNFIIQNNEEEIYNLLEYGMKEFLNLGTVYVTDAFKDLKIIPAPKVSLGVRVSEHWLDLKIEAGELTGSELNCLLKEYRQKKPYYRLKDGSFLKFDTVGFETISELTDGLHLTDADFEKDQIELPKYRAMYLDSVLKNNDSLEISRDNRFKKVIHEMESMEDSDFEVPSPLKDILRGYQVIGFRWLKTLDLYGFGGILADDMGLGKTVQVIALILDEKIQTKKQQRSLIICPASLVYNWENEFSMFAPSLRVLSITGSAGEREVLLKEGINYDVLITSYDLLKRDINIYNSFEFRFQIIDEAQYIKNASTKSANAVKTILAKTRFALTGTPIENRLSELWSIFDYLMSGFLFTYSKFKKEYELPIIKYQDELAIQRMRRMIGPFLLRRLKQDVLKELPGKLETVVYSKFDKEQRNLYDANALELKRMLEGQSEGEYRSKKLTILAELTKLRQLCCDPSLCYENYRGESAKLETCIDLIRNGVEGGHKILLFSQFTSMLSRIEKRLNEEKIVHYLLTGATSKEVRRDMVNSFQEDMVPVFLISLKAGGTGLNLTAADIVIHFDPWWNIATQNQATDRAHRIGQDKVVSVFKLIAKNTIEENIVKLQNSKKDLAEQIITEGSVFLSSLSKEDLIDILG